VLDIDKWSDVQEPYDVITCLNLLDRCDKPLSLLRDAKKVLKSGTGRLVVAVVLPFSPCVESGKLMLATIYSCS
jgi:2-polyprenyl-3-methyl-5-hydroxy-6-metoxy-1,4-benzoquinol methylase